jgi:hypothetical protein
MVEEKVAVPSVAQPVTPVPPVSPTEGPKDNKTLITVLLLLFVYPIGFLLMWFWTKWKTWVKIVVSAIGCCLIIPLIGFMAIAVLSAVNPQAQIQKANCIKACTAEGKTQTACVTECATSGTTGSTTSGQYPTVFRESYLKSCTASGTVSQTLCECILGKIESNYTYDEVMKELPNISDTSTTFYKSMIGFAAECQ